MYYVLAVAAVILLFYLHYRFSRKGRFWRMVGRHPDDAVTLFSQDPDCLVDPVAKPPNAYSGPYRVVASDGSVRRIYILASTINALQDRIGAELLAYDAMTRWATEVFAPDEVFLGSKDDKRRGMFDWFKSKKAESSRAQTGSRPAEGRRVAVRLDAVEHGGTILFEAAIREIHPDRFIYDTDTAAVFIQPRLVTLNTLIGRPPEERFFSLSFDDLVQSVRRLHHAGALSQVVQVAGQDVVTAALLMAAIQEGQPTARFRPQAEIILKYLNIHSKDTAEPLPRPA